MAACDDWTFLWWGNLDTSPYPGPSVPSETKSHDLPHLNIFQVTLVLTGLTLNPALKPVNQHLQRYHPLHFTLPSEEILGVEI